MYLKRKNPNNELLEKLFGKNDENLVNLEMQVQKLVKSATRIELKNASGPVGSSSLKSHFGGLPYFEEGETWPITKAGKISKRD